MNSGMLKYMQDLGERLDNAPRGEKTRIVQTVAITLGMSLMQVYRDLDKAGWSSGRKKRKDAGSTAVSEEVAKQVAGLVVLGQRKSGKRVTTVKASLERLEANNITSKDGGMHSQQAVARAMRLYGCHPDQLLKGKTPVRARSLHPNHVWELDASLCVLFYLSNGTGSGVGLMDKKLYNKNKPTNVERISSQRVWRYVVVDHCSGAFYVHYCMGAEGAENALDALIYAMHKRDDSDAFYGIPQVLYTDAGSGHRNDMVRHFCERLGIEHRIHTPGNARATGAVEVCQNLVERGFESRLSFSHCANLEEIQKAADLWRIHVCAREKHSRTRKTRFSVWTSIQEEHLRIPSSIAVLRELAVGKTVTRKITDFLTISYASKATGGKHEYDVSRMPHVYAGLKVSVRVNAWRAPAVDITVEVEGQEPYTQTVEPVVKDAYGFVADAPVIGESFKSKSKTEAERHLEDIHQTAYGTTNAEETAKAKKEGKKPYAHLDHFADVRSSVPKYFPKQGTVVGQDVPIPEVQPLSHIKAARILAERCGDAWTRDPQTRMAWLRQQHPNGVPPDMLDSLEKTVQRGAAMPLELASNIKLFKTGA